MPLVMMQRIRLVDITETRIGREEGWFAERLSLQGHAICVGDRMRHNLGRVAEVAGPVIFGLVANSVAQHVLFWRLKTGLVLRRTPGVQKRIALGGGNA